ncbi:hypothetical protein [Aureimonas mangrovi]|uniref:hypothetical protein n=1 Tax=Aureimonas mangrovi TaxID=2758041 RepID=UPI00163DB536|nr:hypothetical protein [Aureimonas mangrovi]
MHTISRTLAALALALAASPPLAALAQPFEAGPPGTVVGSSMSGQRIGPPSAPLSPRIANPDVFGDTVEERSWGRDYDDSHLWPVIPTPRAAPSTEMRAFEGQSRLDPARAGTFSRSGPAAIGSSEVTRPRLGAPRAIRRNDGG